ncbi:unnamed protein product [Arctogadus glacialis]
MTEELFLRSKGETHGRGVFAKGSISQGDFVLEYRGDRIPVVEAQRRRLIYHESCTAFLFMFRWRGKTWCIDAARDDGSLGRLVNDEHRRPNCKMKNIDVNGSPHLCLFALMDIKQGEEISYDYGGEDCPWRTETTTVGPNALLVEDLHTVVLANTEVGDATHPNIAQQMTTVGDDALLDGGSKPVLSNTEGDDDATRPKITQQMTTVGDDALLDGGSKPVLSNTEGDDDATRPKITQQMTTVGDDALLDGGSKSVLSNTEGDDDATRPKITQQIPNENEIFVPRLRRTKSIIMKDTVLDDSVQLYDSTSESSDEYIPDSSCDSEDSDVTLKLNKREKYQSQSHGILQSNLSP